MVILLSGIPTKDLTCPALKMVFVHDIVEIDAGDTFCYDEKGAPDKREREEKAVDRIFNILPPTRLGDMDLGKNLKSAGPRGEIRQFS